MSAWQQNQLALQKHLKEDSLDDFLRWSTIRKTMYVGTGAEQIPYEYIALRRDGWHGWFSVVASTGFGADGYKREYDPNLIHQAYHLKQWLDRSGKTIDQLSSIVEIGAGYGAMCLICRRLGFTGWYYIIDLPELVKIQKYYLQQTGVIGKTLWKPSNVVSSTPLDLLIACHSLSEILLAERERLLSQMEANAYLFASSYEFERVDNETWLREFAASKPGYEWNQYAHPYQENALYLVGVKNELAK